MKKKRSAWVIIGLLLIVAALCLTCYNICEQARAEKVSQCAVEGLNGAIKKNTGKEIPNYILNPDAEMPVKSIDGIDYIGILKIPSLGLELPVAGDWSYPLLRSTPCRYVGSAYKNNMVIAAHNYNSHFGRIKAMREGDAVVFTDVDGNIFEYKVAEIEILQPTEVEKMKNGDCDLTLFTCTLGGRTRVTVRCVSADDK